MIGRCADTAGIAYVDIDFEKTTHEAVNYLAGLGHRHIAFLNHSQAEFDAGYGPAVRAHADFQNAIQAAGIEGVTRLCRATPAAGDVALRELLAECPDLTALIAMNDRALPGVIQAIAAQGWRIPDDFSLVAMVSSARVAEMVMPPLTTMTAPGGELGRLSVELLIQQLETQEQPALQQLLPCRLDVRGSSGPCRRNRRTAG
jgi:DNA-binding LacI/PurR family transcriptional regulator